MDAPIKTESSIEAWLQDLPARARAHWSRTGRPLVTLSYAQSLDGSIAARRGQPMALSGAPALRLTHQLRALHAAILVGIETVLADDPALTVRLVPGESPRPVILDSHLRLPLSARLLDRQENLPWIFYAACTAAERHAALEERGARLLPVGRDESGGLELGEVLAKLAEAGIQSLMVEGGARVIGRFLAGGLVDQAVITTAPLWVGGLRTVDNELAGLASFPTLAEPHYQPFGSDLVTWGRLASKSEGRQ